LGVRRWESCIPQVPGGCRHSKGMGEVSPGMDVNGPSWVALASSGFSHTVWCWISISPGARGWQGSFSPAAHQLSPLVSLARLSVRCGEGVQTLPPPHSPAGMDPGFAPLPASPRDRGIRSPGMQGYEDEEGTGASLL